MPSGFRPPGPRYKRRIAANPRHRSSSQSRSLRLSMILSENRHPLFWIMLVSPAKILVQQAEQKMILPDAVDAEIAPRQPLPAEAAFLQHTDRGCVRRDAGGFDAVQVELAEQGRQQHAQR